MTIAVDHVAASARFLILEDIVPPADVATMVDVGLKWHEMEPEELPSPLHRTGSPSDPGPPAPCFINHLQYGEPAFHRLVLNPHIMRVVSALTAGRVTLVDTALTKMSKDGGALNEGQFHGELGDHVPGDHGASGTAGSAVPGSQRAARHPAAHRPPARHPAVGLHD